MEWSEWKKSYLGILDRFKIELKDDELSSKALESHLLKLRFISREKIYTGLREILTQPIVVAGAGPSLETDIKKMIKLNIQKSIQIVSADGATAAFRLVNIVPNIVISDVDGEWESIVWALGRGALILLHGHGDNKDLISDFFFKYHDCLEGKLLWGTSQNDPGDILFNFGGFTDGDRAIFLSFHFQTPLIGLIGMDFGTKIGKYSSFNSEIAKKDINRKIAKFEIAMQLLDEFRSTHKGLRYNLTSDGEPVPGFPKISFQEFSQKVSKYNMLHGK